jgi:DNA-binding IclR family transcriptional regulator
LLVNKKGTSLEVDPAETQSPAARATGSLQTLDRGLQALTLIGNAPIGMSIADLAEQLNVHRTIAYRLVATLAAHGLVTRGRQGALRLGAALVTLASRFEPQLRDVAQPVLDRLANETKAAAFLSVPQGEECVAIMVAEPQTTLLRVAYRIGNRHPLTLGADGIAILAGRPRHSSDTIAVQQARADGYSVTRGQLQAGAMGVACPIHGADGRGASFEASLGLVTLGEPVVAELARAVLTAAADVRALLTGGITRR